MPSRKIQVWVHSCCTDLCNLGADNQPPFFCYDFFQDFTDGNEICRLHEGKVLEQLSEKNIIDIEKAGGTFLFLEWLTQFWVPISGEEVV